MTVSLQQVKNSFSEYQKLTSLEAMSNGAFCAFERMGFPSRKNEDWKYTNINALLASDIQFVPAAPEVKITTGNSFELRNGHLVGAQVLDGVSWRSLGTRTLTDQDISDLSSISFKDGFEALSLSAPSDILVIEVSSGASIKDVLTLNSIYSSPVDTSFCQPLVLIQVGKGAELHLHENIQGKGSGLVNSLVKLQLADSARVHHVKQVIASGSHKSISGLEVSQGRDSFFQSSCFFCGGKVLRHSVTVQQNGTGSESICNGLYLAKDKEHIDFRVNIRHLKPYGVSRQLYKGVLKDSSRAVFNGKIYIDKGAQKTDSSQLNNNLILSKKAEVDSKPELEVYADNVKANHGSTIGQLDKDQLFYLMSRAISREEAIKILAKGFVEEVLLKVESKELRACAYSWLENSLVDFQQSLEQSKRFVQ